VVTRAAAKNGRWSTSYGLQQFTHQFVGVDAKNRRTTHMSLAWDLLQGVEKPTPLRLV
jgi:hypothetical protein